MTTAKLAPVQQSETEPELMVERLLNAAVHRRGQFLVVFLCLFINALDGFDITMMAVVASDVAKALVLSPDRLGLIFSCALAGMMIGAMLVAPLADRAGRRPVILTCIVLVATSMMMTSFATTLWQLLLLRLLSGIGAGAIIVLQAALTAEYSPERYRSLAIAVATSGYPLGAMATAVVAGAVLPSYGWQGLFMMGGLATLGFGLICWFLLPESLKYLLTVQPPGALARSNQIMGRLGIKALDELPSMSKPRSSQGTGYGSGILTVRQLFSPALRTRTFSIWALFFSCFLTLYFLQSWLPRLMETAGYSPETARLAFLLFNLGGVLGIVVLGGLSVRYHLSQTIGIFLALAAASMVAFASMQGNTAALGILALLIGILLQGGFVGLYAVGAKAYPTSFRSTGIGWAIGVGRSGAVIGPVLVGFLLVWGLEITGAFLFFAVPLVVASLVALRLGVR